MSAHTAPKPLQKQSRITGAILVTGAQALVLLLGWITHPLIGRILGPGPYGVFGVVLSLQTIFGLFLTLGVPVAISKFVSQDEEHAQSILKQSLKIQAVIAFIVGGVVLLFAPLFAQALQDSSLTPYIQFIALVIFLQAFYPVFQHFMGGLHQFNKQAYLTATYAILKLAGALSLIFVIGVYGAFAGFAVGGVLAALLGWWWTRNVGGSNNHKLPIKSFLSFAGVYVLILIGLQVIISLDLFMVKAFLGSDEITGFYNASVTLSRIPYMLLQGLGFVLLPSVSALTKPGETHDKAALFIRDTLRYLIALIIPGAALAAATSKSLITLFYSSQYLPAASALTVLIIGLSALAFYQLLANMVAGAGKAKVGLYTTIVVLIISAVLGPILVPQYQLMGAAWQTTIAGIAGLIILGAYTFKTFAIPLPIRSTINVIAASSVAVGLTYVWKATAFTLIPQYIVALGIYAIVLFLLGEVTKDDRKRIASLHPKLAWVAK